MEGISKFSGVQAIVDRAEELRRGGHIEEALEAIERCLRVDPIHSRALLVQCRILYQRGMLAQALRILKMLWELLDGDENITKIAEGLEERWQQPKPLMDHNFITETMADLQVRQGYLWDAMEIYRQLYTGVESEGLWAKILVLRDRLQKERDNTQDEQDEQDEQKERLEALNQWIKKQQRNA